MAVKIRMTRGGSKNRPYYTIIATDSRSPRDGAFLEKLGSYNPTLPKESAERFKFDKDRVQAWLDKGAQPSDLVARYLVKAGVIKEDKKNHRPARQGKTAPAGDQSRSRQESR